MNPIVYGVKPRELIPFLLTGEMVGFLDGKPTQRIWHLNVYSSAKSRRIAAKKLKRGTADIIFIEWDITLEQLIQQGKMIFPVASEKVLQTDKLNVFQQLSRRHK
jgi:tRNA A37 threonylcarbamoyladenosine biosynthesis protein TsaE